MLAAGAYWWLFGIWVVCLVVFFSTVSSNATGVLLGTGSSVLVSYLVGLLPKIGKLVPTVLLNSSSLLAGVETTDSYMKPLGVTFLLCIACFVISIPIMDKRQI